MVCSKETFQARREWDDIQNTEKKMNANQEFYAQQSCPSEIKRQKVSWIKQKQKEFNTIRSVLQKRLKGVL